VPLNGYIIWDSKTGLVYMEDSNKNQSLIPYNGNSCGAIPVGGTNTVRIQQYDSDKKLWQDWARIEDNIWKKYDDTQKQWVEWTESSRPVLEYDYWYY
jgi:hypothetical protein